MKSEIYFGMKAGKVWETLSKGTRTMTQLQKATGLTLRDVSMGLGWLAREGKIQPENAKSKNVRFKLVA
jgi:hypothetical protein